MAALSTSIGWGIHGDFGAISTSSASSPFSPLTEERSALRVRYGLDGGAPIVEADAGQNRDSNTLAFIFTLLIIPYLKIQKNPEK